MAHARSSRAARGASASPWCWSCSSSARRSVTAGRDLDDLDPRLTPARDAGRLTLIAADLATAEGRAALIDAIPDAWGALDILVNNVGTNIRKPSLAFYQRRVPDRPLHQPDLSMGADVGCSTPALKASGHGRYRQYRLGLAGLRAVGSGAVYAMSKAALAHLTRTGLSNGRATAFASTRWRRIYPMLLAGPVLAIPRCWRASFAERRWAASQSRKRSRRW